MKKCFLTFSYILIVFALFSCADSSPGVMSVVASTVFDYKDYESLPETRLAVFIQTSSDVQRADNFETECMENGYKWQILNPGVFTGSSRKWVFSSNLQNPYGEKITTGSYNLSYHDAAGEKCEATFSVDYDIKILESNANEAMNLIQNSAEYISLYDKSGNLIFFGKKRTGWNTNADIVRDFRLAYEKRTCITNLKNSVFCMMPAELLR